jgi:hypothetical protein
MEFLLLEHESLLNRIVFSLSGVALVFKLQPEDCKCQVSYCTANLHMTHNMQFTLSYLQVISARLLHVVEAEPSVADVTWSFNIVCVDSQSEGFHCAC